MKYAIYTEILCWLRLEQSHTGTHTHSTGPRDLPETVHQLWNPHLSPALFLPLILFSPNLPQKATRSPQSLTTGGNEGYRIFALLLGVQ